MVRRTGGPSYTCLERLQPVISGDLHFAKQRHWKSTERFKRLQAFI